MTQCDRVLSMLRAAGKRGVRSDEFFRVGLPRGVARIYDLRQRGVEIEDEPEGKYKRFRLVGVGGGGSSACSPASLDRCSESSVGASLHSGEGTTGGREQIVPQSRDAVSGVPARSVPSMFDADDCLTWGA